MIESREMDKIFVVNLAEAIIAQAAKDYRNALKGVGIRYKKAALVRQECEEFFRSDYYKNFFLFFDGILF